MKKAIVLGATGGTGAAITKQLIQRGIPTIAFGRSLEKLQRFAEELGRPTLLEIAAGDAFQLDPDHPAFGDADMLFHCANVPYHEMERKLLPLGESVMTFAHRRGMKVIVVDGIYPYGRRTTEKATEDHPKRPHTRKGKTRLAYEQLIFDGRFHRAQAAIVRLPDYYGPTANEASYLGSTLEGIALGKPTAFIGNLHIPREYVYLPDAADMIVRLALTEHVYGQNWHIPGSGVISGREIVRLARKASGVAVKPVIPLGRAGLTLLGLFVPVMKEVVEMLYLTEEPFVLSGEKFRRRIGPIAATSFEEGIEETIRAIQSRRGTGLEYAAAAK
ncbi:NAD-dependent epimerase/dehydratase family protein [Paenibacillus chartarius]|uniref:NAD-dependent epimerase/dehydratase family protein n=1 Tax=Paenibacillus chartarius TaxID=747481 RepID=A0ABV6DH70_9BACL